MLENRFLAGVVAGLPVSLLCIGYVLARREAVIAAVLDGADGATLSPGTAAGLMLVAGAAIGPGLGLLAALVYGAVQSDQVYLALAFGLATAFTVAALVSHTPMTAEKTVLNYAVAASLGLLLPRLLAA